jgi:hypothetical protein
MPEHKTYNAELLHIRGSLRMSSSGGPGPRLNDAKGGHISAPRLIIDPLGINISSTLAVARVQQADLRKMVAYDSVRYHCSPVPDLVLPCAILMLVPGVQESCPCLEPVPGAGWQCLPPR